MSKQPTGSGVIPIADGDRIRRKVRSTPKGRTLDPQALAEVRSLIGADPRRADLLIEYLHRIQDLHGHISSAHVVALAAELKLAMTEVYEVATFYHHFDVVKDAEAAPPALTVRVCDSLACEMAGAKELLEQLAKLERKDVRFVAVPCVGRCDAAPVAVVGQNPLEHASALTIAAALNGKKATAVVPEHIALAQYRAAGGYRTLRECLNGTRDPESVLRAMENSGLRGLGGAGFPAGRKWRIVRAEKAPRL